MPRRFICRNPVSSRSAPEASVSFCCNGRQMLGGWQWMFRFSAAYFDGVPMSKMLRMSEQDLQRFVSRGMSRQTPASQDDVKPAPDISEQAIRAETQGAGDRADAATCGQGSGVVMLPATPGIYRITDIKTGRFYIGSSVNVANRWRQHQYRLVRGTHPNPILQALWNSNPDRIQIEIAHTCPQDKGEILKAEQAALDAAGVGVNRMCMNVLSVAGSHLGRKRSAETCAALSAANTGKRHTEESKAKMSAAKLGRKQSDEHRMKCSIARTGKTINRKKGGCNKGIRKFSDTQIIEMRKMKESGLSYSEIEAIHSVSHGGLQKIVKRDTYRDVANG